MEKATIPKWLKQSLWKKYPLFPKIYSKTWQSPKSLCAYVPDLQGDMCDLVITGGGGTTPPSQVPFPLGQFASHLFCWKRRPKTAHNALNLKKILFPPRVIGRLLICLPSLGLTAHSAKKLKWRFNNFSFWNDWKIKISRRKLHHLREFQTILKKGHLMKNFQISVPSQTWSNRV